MFLVEFTQCIRLSGRRQKKTSPLPHIKKKKIEAITFVPALCHRKIIKLMHPAD